MLQFMKNTPVRYTLAIIHSNQSFDIHTFHPCMGNITLKQPL